MRPTMFPTATPTSNSSLMRVAAESVDALTVHFPHPVGAGGRLLPAGNYTITTPKGIGELPVIRFQGENGNTTAVVATREYISLDEASPCSEVVLRADGEEMLRIVNVFMEGNQFQFVLPVSDFTN